MKRKISYVSVTTGWFGAMACSSGLPNAPSDAGNNVANQVDASQSTGVSSSSTSSNVTSTSTSGDDGSSLEASADVASGDAPTEEGGVFGLGGSCIAELFGVYVLRTDGVLIDEDAAGSPETIIDDSTGFPLQGIVNVGVGAAHACAALSDGSVECWQVDAGSGNTSGQLGNGSTTANGSLYRATPVLTAPNTPLSGVVAVATSDSLNSNTSCAVRNDGTLYCWGDLTWIVNNGTTLLTGYAQAITIDGSTPLTGVTQAVVGPLNACALAARDGGSSSVWCWGFNSFGELGVGDANNRQYPTLVGGLTSPTKLVIDSSAGNYRFVTVCAQDGTNVRCWGANPTGAAGANTTTNPILSPTAVVTMSGALLDQVSDLQTGVDAFGILRNDGTIWTWGGGSYFATSYGLTNVVALGWAGPTNGPRFITSDSVYHDGMTAFTVDCNAM